MKSFLFRAFAAGALVFLSACATTTLPPETVYRAGDAGALLVYRNSGNGAYINRIQPGTGRVIGETIELVTDGDAGVLSDRWAVIELPPGEYALALRWGRVMPDMGIYERFTYFERAPVFRVEAGQVTAMHHAERLYDRAAGDPTDPIVVEWVEEALENYPEITAPVVRVETRGFVRLIDHPGW